MSLKFIKTKVKKAGLPPGSLVYVGEKQAEEPLITIFDYTESGYTETIAESAENTFPFRDGLNVSWINVSRVTDVGVVEKIGAHFRVHPLILEDILTQGQRPKIEDMDDYLFIILNMLSFDDQNGRIRQEQVSMAVGGSWLITFQEIEGDVFDTIRDRIRTGKGRIRRMRADYLAYSLIDAIVDNYFIIMENLGERIENVEEQLIISPDNKTLTEIHALRKEMLYLHKSVWPLREVVSKLERSDSDIIQDSTRMYFRDVYDHTVQVMDSVETFRDMLSGILETYLSSVSNRLNDIMRVLTIISTIFIPLTFLAGVYGMNFRHMPELNVTWAYPALWGAMVLLAMAMLYLFRRKRWL